MINRLLAYSLLVVIPTAFAINSSAQVKKPIALNHIAVYVKDLQSMTEFYQHVVGMDTMPEPFHDGRHTWFPIGPHSQLHLIKGAKEVTQHDKNGHLCFTVASVDDFVAVLIKNKIHYEDWPGKAYSVTNRVDGVKQVYFQDPENNWIEINDDKY